MTLFLDRHTAPGTTATQVAAAHELDLGIQDKYHVRYVTYWFDEGEGTVFCLAEGLDRDSLEAVHREAHGLMAENIIEVGPGPMNAFMGELPRHPPGEVYEESPVRAVLFTDICDSTQKTQDLGDEGFMELLRRHDEVVREALEERGGREVKHTGDGIMAAFTSVSGAVESGIAMQQELRRRNEEGGHKLDVRIGLSVGEPVTDHDDLFGATVQLSARLCGVARPGGIAVSTGVRELCVGKRFAFAARGPIQLKGFAEPMQIFDVQLPAQA